MTKRKSEVTSKRVAAIAGRVLKKISALPEYDQKNCAVWWDDTRNDVHYILSFRELKALCASALTQAEGKK